MSVNYITSLKTTRLSAVQAAINSLTPATATGTASNGSLVIGTSSFVNTAGTASVTSGSTGVLTVLPLPNAGVTVSGSTLSLISTTDSATATGTGTAATAAVINNAGTVVVGGLTVGTASADVILNSVAISSGQTVSITSAAINHA